MRSEKGLGKEGQGANHVPLGHPTQTLAPRAQWEYTYWPLRGAISKSNTDLGHTLQGKGRLKDLWEGPRTAPSQVPTPSFRPHLEGCGIFRIQGLATQFRLALYSLV